MVLGVTEHLTSHAISVCYEPRSHRKAWGDDWLAQRKFQVTFGLNDSGAGEDTSHDF